MRINHLNWPNTAASAKNTETPLLPRYLNLHKVRENLQSTQYAGSLSSSKVFACASPPKSVKIHYAVCSTTSQPLLHRKIVSPSTSLSWWYHTSRLHTPHVFSATVSSTLCSSFLSYWNSTSSQKRYLPCQSKNMATIFLIKIAIKIQDWPLFPREA